MATSLQDVLDKAQKKAASNQFQRTAKPKPGRSVWRILPGWDSKEPNLFFQAYGQHFIKNMDGELKVVIGCPDKTFDEPTGHGDVLRQRLDAKSLADVDAEPVVLQAVLS